MAAAGCHGDDLRQQAEKGAAPTEQPADANANTRQPMRYAHGSGGRGLKVGGAESGVFS